MKIVQTFTVTFEVSPPEEVEDLPRWRDSVSASIAEFGESLTDFLNNQPLVCATRLDSKEAA